MKNSLVSKLDIYIFIYICLISIFIGIRSDSVGADTRVYADYFSELYLNKPFFYEPLFEILSRIVKYICNDRFFYFFCLSFLFNFLWFKSLKVVNFYFNLRLKEYLVYFITLSLISSWYITALTNGLRQGLALCLLYLAIFYLLFQKRKKVFIVLYLLSCLFHYSNFIYLPLFILFLFKRKWEIFFLLIALMYPLGINEKIVYFFSNVSGLDVYSSIKNYISDEESKMWVGFQTDFYIYSMFWAIIPYIFNKLILGKNPSLEIIIKIYCMLLTIYFFYGFGAFSNRFAFVAWLFLPFLQYSLLCLIKETSSVSRQSRFLFIYVMIVIAIINLFTYYGFKFL